MIGRNIFGFYDIFLGIVVILQIKIRPCKAKQQITFVGCNIQSLLIVFYDLGHIVEFGIALSYVKGYILTIWEDMPNPGSRIYAFFIPFLLK